MLLQPRRKLFCIGFNKTGTTSLAAAISSFGLRVGDQVRAELLVDDWARRDFRRIIAYCRIADAFQDVPFSLNHTYGVLDHAYPGAKFILTVRDSADEWFDSLLRFHAKLIGKQRVPTADDLREFSYHGTGWLWHAHQLLFNVDETNLYDRDHYVAQYELHNRQVLDYFRHRPEDLLVLNIGKSNAMQSLCDFLGFDYDGRQMPHLNISRQAA
jgi:hypothetical protein